MLSRAVILFLFVSNAWSAGVAIELDTGVSIGSLCYTNTDGASDSVDICDVNKDTEVESIVEPVGYEPQPLDEIKPVLRAIQSRPPEVEPASIVLSKISNAELIEQAKEGIVEINSQDVWFNSNFSTNKKIVYLNDDNLYVYTNERRLNAYTLDFDGTAEHNFYPELPYGIEEFDLYNVSSDYIEEGVGQTHALPYAIDSRGFIYSWWQSSEQTMRFEGQWKVSNYTTNENAIPNERLLPNGSDDVLVSTVSPAFHKNYDGDFIQKGDSTGILISYNSGISSGLWMNAIGYDGVSFSSKRGIVSHVDLTESNVIHSHKGLTQLYIDIDGVATLRYIEDFDFPYITIESSDSDGVFDIKSIYSENGTLYTVYLKDSVKLAWDDASSGIVDDFSLPNGVTDIEMCDVTLERIFCVMGKGEQYYLYELVDGQFVEDRVLSHDLLEQGFVSVDGVFAYGENRFIAIKTLDLRHRLFNFSVNGAFHTKKTAYTGDSLKTEIIESNDAGVFFWLSSSNAAVYANKVQTSLLAEPEETEIPENIVIPDGREKDENETDKEADEEDKEVPFVEMEGSLNIYLLMLALLILMPLRFAKK